LKSQPNRAAPIGRLPGKPHRRNLAAKVRGILDERPAAA
jgi:hypothetical protein